MFALSRNPDRDLPSLFTRALAGRRIDLGGGKPAEVHLYTALAACWRKGSETAATLLSELRKLQATSPASKNYDEGPVPQALRALIYAATEAFDLYHQTIPKRLEGGRGRPEVQRIREYQAAVKRLRDPVSLMCNLMKHQYREIVTGRIVSQVTGEATFVYRINVAHGGIQVPDRDVHRAGGFASVERTLHEIVHGLLRADVKAGELVRALSDNHGLAIELKGPSSLGLAGVLDGLDERTPTVAHSEPGLFDGVQVLADQVLLTRVSARKVAEPTTRTMKITVDEAAPSVQVFL
jgi:hypothetical protein